MTIRRRPRRGRLAAALVLTGAVLYLVAATAGSSTVQGALERLGRQGDLALAILRCQLGGWTGEDGLPPAAALCIGQSPVLLSGREAVLGLWQSVEEDDSAGGQEVPEKTPPPSAAPLPEEPVEPEAPPEFPDNGVAARTLSPSSPEGYLVAGDVYINNRSDLELDASIFHETFAAALAEEEGPQVLIVHTHGSEAYSMTDGDIYEESDPYRTTDCAHNVVRVGEEMATVFRAYGFQVIHDTTLCDYPAYNGAYDRSKAVAEQWLERYPSIKVVFDVHRDALVGNEGEVYKLVSDEAGQKVAQVMMVLGTDAGGADHPRWKDNLAFALSLQRNLVKGYASLARPTVLRKARYNQQLCPGSVLVEVGGHGNSLSEAIAGGRLWADNVARTLLEMKE